MNRSWLVILWLLIGGFYLPTHAKVLENATGQVTVNGASIKIRYAIGFWDDEEKRVKIYLMTRVPSADEVNRIKSLRDRFFSPSWEDGIGQEPRVLLHLSLQDALGKAIPSNLKIAQVDLECFPPDPDNWHSMGWPEDVKQFSGKIPGGPLSGHFQGRETHSPIRYVWNFKIRNVEILPVKPCD